MDSTRLALAALAVPLALAAAAPPGHAEQARVFQADLGPLSGSGARGSATMALDGDLLTVEITTGGMTADQPHLQHLRFGGRDTCPPPQAAGDGALSTAELVPYTGDIQVSLTTEGDTGPQSALAVTRMPAADAGGTLSYRRAFRVPDRVAAALEAGRVTIVQYGVDVNGNGRYDSDAGLSDLDPSLYAEATFPATCGQVKPVPQGGTSAGEGGAAGADPRLLGLGALLIAAAGGTLAWGRRLRRGR